MERNSAFFAAHENWFLETKEYAGEEAALRIMAMVMEKALGAAYGKPGMGFKKGDPREYARLVGERDAAVGLKVKFPEIADNRLVYRFHDDPFPNLKGHVDPERLDATYMRFKVSYILGEGWTYRTTRHLWSGDPFTEHVIEKT